MFIPATKYITEGFAIYLIPKTDSQIATIKITYSDINPILDWLKCNKQLTIYEEDILILREPRIVTINYTLIKGFYTIDVSYKQGLYIVDNESITIGLVKDEKTVHINFPQSAYKLI